MSLPLRLAAEPFVRETFGQSCFVLPSLDEDKVCFIVADAGLLGLAVNRHYQKDEIAQITTLPIGDLPVCFLVRGNAKEEHQRNTFQWVLPTGSDIDPSGGRGVRSEDILHYTKLLSVECAMSIIQSIERCAIVTHLGWCMQSQTWLAMLLDDLFH
jgi:hypothetical protein